MPPLNDAAIWFSRSEDRSDPIAPERIVYVVCEGQNTEDFYFKSLFGLLEAREIPHRVQAIYCEKTDGDATASHPKRLLELAIKKIQSNEFEPGDEMAIVFDVDKFKNEGGYPEFLNKCERNGVRAVVTYPSFEVFLILHIEGAVENHIRPNEKAILDNRKVSGNRRYIKALCSKITGHNPERRGVGQLAYNFEIALAAEQKINRDGRNALGVITSNVGQFIQYLIDG